MLVQHLDVEADGFLPSEGVHVAADGINRAGDVAGRARLGALEHHVLDKMGDAVRFQQLVSRACLHPDTDGDGANVSHLLAEHKKTVRQALTMDVATFTSARLCVGIRHSSHLYDSHMPAMVAQVNIS